MLRRGCSLLSVAGALLAAGGAAQSAHKARCAHLRDTVSSATPGGAQLTHRDQMFLNLALRLRGELSPVPERVCVVAYAREDGQPGFVRGVDTSLGRVGDLSAVASALGALRADRDARECAVSGVYVVTTESATADLRPSELELLSETLRDDTTPVVTAGRDRVEMRSLGSLLPRHGGRLRGLQEGSDEALPEGARALYELAWASRKRVAGAAVLYSNGDVRVAEDLRCSADPGASIDGASQLLPDMLEAKDRGVRPLVFMVFREDGALVAPAARVRALAKELGLGSVSVVVNDGPEGAASHRRLGGAF